MRTLITCTICFRETLLLYWGKFSILGKERIYRIVLRPRNIMPFLLLLSWKYLSCAVTKDRMLGKVDMCPNGFLFGRYLHDGFSLCSRALSRCLSVCEGFLNECREKAWRLTGRKSMHIHLYMHKLYSNDHSTCGPESLRHFCLHEVQVVYLECLKKMCSPILTPVMQCRECELRVQPSGSIANSLPLAQASSRWHKRLLSQTAPSSKIAPC